MPTNYPDLFAELARPFEPHQVKARPGSRGAQLHYVTSRTVQNRLDEVVGPERWSDRYYEVCNVLFCEITLTLPDGSTVSKSDAGGFKQMTDTVRGQQVADEENTDKTGASDSFKRAAAKFGIARYLYRDGVPDFVSERVDSAPPAEAQQGRRAPDRAPHQSNGHAPQQAPQGGRGAPRNGRALYAWCADQQNEHPGFVKRTQDFVKRKFGDMRLIDLDDAQAQEVYAAACRELGREPEGARPGAPTQDVVANQKEELTKTIHSIHRARTGHPEAGVEDFYALLDELSGECDGETIADLPTCRDSRLLGRFIAAATNLLGTESAL